MRASTVLAGLFLFGALAPVAAADVTVQAPAFSFGPLTGGPTSAGTSHTSWSSGAPPCASSGQEDTAYASTKLMNERLSVQARQQRTVFDCGGSGTYEATDVRVVRETGDTSSTLVLVGVDDSQGSSGHYCGSYVSVAGAGASPGCLPFGTRPPYVLDLLP